ncbi:651_t:CDS:2, partial [Gigaspora rosea]
DDKKNDITKLNNPYNIEDDSKKLLVDSNNNNIEDDKKIINELQRKNLDELFSYLVYFITEFNAHDNTCLKGMKPKAIDLGKFYIKQRN